MKLKCSHSPLKERIYSPTSVPFRPTTVQMPNLALVETKRFTVQLTEGKEYLCLNPHLKDNWKIRQTVRRTDRQTDKRQTDSLRRVEISSQSPNTFQEYEKTIYTSLSHSYCIRYCTIYTSKLSIKYCPNPLHSHTEYAFEIQGSRVSLLYLQTGCISYYMRRKKF